MCRVNTFEKRVIVGKDDAGRNKYHSVHEYTDTLKNMYTEFLGSTEFAAFTRRTGRILFDFQVSSMQLQVYSEAQDACMCRRSGGRIRRAAQVHEGR